MKIKNLKLKIKNLTGNPLFSGSFVMIVGSNFANFISYVYHLIMGRILGPSSYGELTAIISLEGLLSSLFTFSGLVIVKFVSSAKKNELDSIFAWFSRKALLLASVMTPLLLFATPVFSNFLHIDSKILILVGPISFFFLLAFVLRSFLQGLLKFGSLVIVNNSEFLARLVLGVVFIYLGFSVFGAVLGIFLAAVLGFILATYFLKDYKIWGSKFKFKNGKNVLVYTAPVFLAALTMNSLITTDVVLFKHFFDPVTSGIYASISTLGKIIFYATAPVSSVMFPLVARKKTLGQNYRKIFFLSLSLTLLVAVGVLLLYGFFPKISINILYGSKYLSAAPFLFRYGVFVTVYSLSSLFISYYLSLGKTRMVILALVSALVQILGIVLFHNSVQTVINVSIASVSFLLLSLLIYWAYGSRKLQE